MDFHSDADIYVINTCTVTIWLTEKSRQMLHRASTEKSDAIHRCRRVLYRRARENRMEAVEAVGISIKSDIVEITVRTYLWWSILLTPAGTDIGAVRGICRAHGAEPHTRAYIKIGWILTSPARIVIIPFVRGRPRAEIQEDVLAPIVLGLAEKGFPQASSPVSFRSSFGIGFYRIYGRRLPENGFHFAGNGV